MLRYYSNLRCVMRTLMIMIVPLNIASQKVLRWLDGTHLVSISKEPDGSTVYRHPTYSQWGVKMNWKKDVLPSICCTPDDDAKKLRSMMRIQNCLLERVLYKGVFRKDCVPRRLNLLFVYVDKVLCTWFFDRCYVTCDVLAKEIPSLVGIEGSTIRVVDDSLDEKEYANVDVVFSI